MDGIISISARYYGEKEIEIVIHDNGVGIGRELDLINIKTLGLKIASLLIENQLEGHWSVSDDNGACYKIYFPVQERKLDALVKSL